MDVLIATRTTVEEIGTTRNVRPHVSGKFLWLGDEKLFVRGVTYGTFGPNSNDEPFPEPERAERDLATIHAAGMNCIRTYTPPPIWLLDAAQRHDLLVLAGLPWEQHVAFLDDPGRADRIVADVRRAAGELAGHAALLGVAVGNEIPADVVRWHGKSKIERFLFRLVSAVKSEDPQAIVTYVNFPTTEYLELPFVDFFCFNVYLEERDQLEAYLARLQNLAGDKPLVMAEVGLDSRRNGLQRQADTLAWQIESVFEAGAAGCFLFAWTDEWFRGGEEILDWDFGLVDRERTPKPALAAVARAYSAVPFGCVEEWPKMSVAICSYNGERTLQDALEGAIQLDYPDFEVIVVDDGSTDRTAEIASRYPVRLIRTENRGLSAARNSAWSAAGGEIVAYTDDDARPDPSWLRYLALAFRNEDVAGAGGPNLPPPRDGLVASCVANAPGGPTHVLLDDVSAEHVPGCNMAFRRDVLEEVGGFDPRYRAAGDDVDLCWRVRDTGDQIAFSPAAVVWHRRRDEVATYWKQQQGYGKAESLLEEKWPERYNGIGHLAWRGRIYGSGLVQALHLRPPRIYHGLWGSAPFQILYNPSPGALSLATMPEWYLLVPILAAIGVLGLSWQPLLWAWLAMALVLMLPIAQAIKGAATARFGEPAHTLAFSIRRRALTGWLHLIQPIARLKGRLEHGLTPWRRRGWAGWIWPGSRTYEVWSETWRSREDWLRSIESALRERGAATRRGGDFDRWDIEVRGGLLGRVRIASMVEEHGQGRQMLRVRTNMQVSRVAELASIAILALAVGTAIAGATVALVAFTTTLLGVFVMAGGELGSAAFWSQQALEGTRHTQVPHEAVT